MKSVYLKSVLTIVVSLFSIPTMAQWQGNIGLVSEYFFRGIDQDTGASAFLSANREFNDGLSTSIKAIDISDGIELNINGSYEYHFQQEGSAVTAITLYKSSSPSTFKNDANEFNIFLNWRAISFELTNGVHLHKELGQKNVNYSFMAISARYQVFWAKIGRWDSDAFEQSKKTSITDKADKDDHVGAYVELGFKLPFNELNATLELIASDDKLSIIDRDPNTPGKDTEVSLIFSLYENFNF